MENMEVEPPYFKMGISWWGKRGLWDNFLHMNALGSGVVNILRQVWRVVRWPIGILAALYVGLVIYELFHLPKVTAATIAAIHAQRLTMADADGKHLPPQPDPKLVDATVEGIDANKNGVRDDVELAIFKKYPNDAKIRAAELQYAMDQQMYLTLVINTETWKAAAVQLDRGYQCIAGTYPRDDLNKLNIVTNMRTSEVETLQYNTAARKLKREDVSKNITSYGLSDGDYCDVM